MKPARYDIFRVAEKGIMLWVTTAETLEAAEAQIQIF